MLALMAGRRSRKISVFLLVASITVLFLAGLSDAAIQCYDCHGTHATGDYRPDDAAYRNISTGAFKGNHRTHMGSGATPGTCEVCHGAGAASYTNAHRNGQVSIATNINSSPATGTYSRGTSFAQSATPTLGTCSTVNCHFEAATPTWGADPALTTCSTCHGAAPADGSHPAPSGSGKKHGDYYGLTTSSCAKCHPDHTTEAKPFTHATSAGNRALVVAFTSAPNSGFGRYTGNTNYPNYLPSQSPPRNGTCKNLYCHSPGNKASSFDLPNNSASWGGSLTCKGCHKADKVSGDVIISGSHRGHVDGMTLGYTQIKCVKCHAATTNSSMTIVSTVNHVDKQVTVAFNNTSSATAGYYNTQLAKPASPSTKAPGSAVGQCTTVYCHSSGQGDGGTWPPTYQSPTWGTGSTGQCGTCHGIQTKHDASGFGLGTATPLTTGSHTRHLTFDLGTGNVSAERKCAACHSYTLTGYAPNACSSTVCHNLMPSKHANYEINVGIPDYYGATATYNAASLTPGTGYSTCSNVYCHSDGKATPTAYATPTWGNATSGACGTCHGVTAAAPPASTPHAKHVGSASPYRFACAECHSGKVQVTANSTIAPTFTNLTSHVNKVRDVKFAPTNPFGTYSSAITTCRNLYCHSTGNTSVAAGNLPGVYGGSVYVRQGWTGSLSCNSCHGRSTSNGMPDYTNAGAVGSATSNSHPKHVTSSAIACNECHEKTTKNNTSIRPTTPSYHTNGGRNVFFNLSGNSAAGTYDGALKKCSSTYCHGAGASLAWGGTAYCNSCHSANDGTSGGGGVNNWGTGVSAHTLHVEDTTTLPSKYTNYSTGNLSGSTTTYRFGCASCHNPASATHVSGYASNPYRAQVFFGYTSPGKKPAYTYTGTAGTADNGFAWSNGNTVCNQTYCHSNGAGGTGAAVSWATVTNSATNTRCKTCHGYTTASGSAIATGTHGTHISGSTYNLSCRKCHAATTTDGATITDKTKHVNKAVNIAFNNSTTAVNGTYNGIASPMSKNPGSAYASCANTYCHSQGTSTTPVAPNIVATWGGSLDTNCTGCHNGDNVAINKMATYSHTMHVQSYGFDCALCHSATVSNSRAIATPANHVNRFVDVQFSAWVNNAATYAGSTPKSKLPGSTVGACANTYCHSDGTAVANGTITANTTVNWGTAGPLACNACHGNGTYGSDFRKAAPLYATGSPKGNAHDKHTKVGSLTGTYMQCNNCHAATTTSTTITDATKHVNKAYDVSSVRFGVFSSSFRDGDNTMNSTKVTVAYTYNAGGSTCSNVSCHPIGLDSATGLPETRAAASVAWNSAYKCIDCHSMNMQETDTFHHAMRNYSTGYPTSAPNGNATTGGTNMINRRCTMCHVDHNIFSPDINGSSSGRAYNLRTDIGTSPTTASGYTNTDFQSTGSGGICISCHTNAKTKDTTMRRNDTGVTVTPTITLANYSSSGHEYGVPAKFMSDGSVVNGNCSKCHNALQGEISVFMNATSAYQFGNHNSGIRRLQGSLGAAGGETAEEQICYRCHSKITDQDPGGGPPKKTAGKDYYGVASMSAAAEDLFTANKNYRLPSATSITSKLFFKPSSVETPAAPTPDTPANDGDLGDPFAGGTYIIRSMSPWSTTTSYETKSQTTNQSGTKYWEMVKFVSPAVATTVTVPAGSWVINIYSRESSTSQNARIRYMVYKWTSGDALGATIINKGTYATELSTASAPGANRQIAVDLGAITLNAGEKIVVDLALETTASYSYSSYTASYYFGGGAPSNLTLPGAVEFSYADPGTSGYGHNVTQYVGIHRPSPTDETQAYISANKHVECVDCHNPHAAKAGTHTPGNATLASVLRGVAGAIPTYGTTNWTAPTGYSLGTATAEYQICFKCHSGANTNYASWGGSGALAWTDLGLEFNRYNKSGHPVVASLNNYPNSSGALSSTIMQTGWTAVGTQIMTCSDCHASDSIVSKGPHGSTVKWMLNGTNKAWPFTSASQNGGSTGTTYKLNNIASGTDDGLFCMNCHKVSTSSNTMHSRINSQHSGYSSGIMIACVSCHIRVPHGGKVKRLIRTDNTPARYLPNGNGGDVSGQTRQVIKAYNGGTTFSASGCFHSGGSDTW